MAYDSSGNLKSLVRYRADATPIDWQTYTTATTSNRLTSLAESVGASPETWDAEAGSFTYDLNGNMLTSPQPYSIAAATYDFMNLPTSLTRAGMTSTYRYNADGQRIAKQVGAGNTEVYILDGRTTLAVYAVNSAGTLTSSYHNIVAADRVVGRQSSGVKRYYYTDMLGSTRAVVENGAIVESYDYDPWGVLLDGRILAGPTKEGFTGNERDAETGLDYFGLRYYMPAIGRWTTVDPPSDSFPSWSPYNYVENSPVTYTDPLGLWPAIPIILGGEALKDLALAGAATAALAFVATQAEAISQSVSDAVEVVRDKVRDYKFVSYTRTHPVTGQVYSGRTSGFGRPEQLVAARARTHPARLATFGPAVVDRVARGNAQGFMAVRGREQQLIDRHGRAQSEGGTSANLIRGVAKLIEEPFLIQANNPLNWIR